MIAILADTVSSATAVGIPIGVTGLLGLLIKIMLSDRQRGERIEATLRKAWAEERTAREAEFTAEKAAAKADYDSSIARHQAIHDRETAQFEGRIAGYVDELKYTKDRVTILEDRVKMLEGERPKS